MMDAIWEWARHIAFLAVLAALVEIVVPDGGLRPYVRYVVALVWIAALIDPFVGLTRQSGGFAGLEILSPAEPGWSRQADEWARQGHRRAQLWQERLLSEYAAGLEGQVAALVALAEGGESVETRVEMDAAGRLRRLEVRGAREGSAERLIQVLSGFYGLPADAVRITEEGRRRG